MARVSLPSYRPDPENHAERPLSLGLSVNRPRKTGLDKGIDRRVAMRRYLRAMQDIPLPAPPRHRVWLIINHTASAAVLCLCAALPATAVTVLLAVGASCLTSGGCETPTAVDTLVPVVAIAVWTFTALLAGARQIQTLLSTDRHPRTPTPAAPRGIRP